RRGLAGHRIDTIASKPAPTGRRTLLLCYRLQASWRYPARPGNDPAAILDLYPVEIEPPA
ncbi:MAG: hypothetical protein WCA48_01625, partial [Pseudomonas gingeri]